MSHAEAWRVAQRSLTIGQVAGEIWLITGAQASGKSTLAEVLAREFERSVHVRGGQFYRWAVQGWAHFDHDDQSEARRLLELRYRLSAMVAAEYADAEFTAVVQDNIYGQDVVEWLERVAPRRRHLVVLRPSVEVLAARDTARMETTGKVAYRGGFTVEANDAALGTTPADLGLWLDTSRQTPEETVAEILARREEAVVPQPPAPSRRARAARE
jgi:chloramphenicol 3-O-phosphotransferase